MNSELHKNIFSETECLSEQQMFDYIDGKLNSGEEHAVEKHLIDCELCSDALEGLKLVQNRSIISETKQEVKKLILNPEKKTNYYAYYAIAASVLVIFGLWFIFNPAQEDISKNIAEVKILNDSSKQIAETSTTVSENKNTDSTPQIASKKNKVEIALNERKVDKREKEDIMELNTIVPEEDKTTVATTTGDEAASGMALAKDAEVAKPVSANEAEPAMAVKSSRAEEDVALRDDAKESLKTESSETQKAKKSSSRNAAPSAAPQESVSLFRESKNDTTVYKVAEQMPTYSGGEKELAQFISKNFTLKNDCNTCFSTIVNFVVGIDGKTYNHKIVRTVKDCECYEQEAIRVIKLLPKLWISGKNNGKFVAVEMNLPIKN